MTVSLTSKAQAIVRNIRTRRQHLIDGGFDPTMADEHIKWVDFSHVSGDLVLLALGYPFDRHALLRLGHLAD